MYTVSFYSFKGGVGRSMSLVNVAVQLASLGKRVLIVDFDLEAPGLTTFRFAAGQDASKGLVEYVTSYRSSGESPDVRDFVYRTTALSERGEIWVMPAGKHDADYSARLNSIDWRVLYKEEQGYLLFEDLKQQWLNSLAPDYVLIDSRTGHSDVEGICTRQLPEAVCFLFFPNEQNLQGLRKVALSVREQNKQMREREPILLHFVVSNVPDLDDEEEILGRTLERFKLDLGYQELAATIHHYNSLSLLNQEIFSLSHPKSRLAREYRDLTDAIVSENLSDRSSAVRYLRRALSALKNSRGESVSSEILERCERILESFPLDTELSIRVALVYEASGRVTDALTLLSDVQKSYDAAAYAVRARLNFRLGRKSEARSDIEQMLNAGGAERSSFIEATSYLPQLDSSLYADIPHSRALASLSIDDRLFAASSMEDSRHAQEAQAQILDTLLHEAREADLVHTIRHRLVLTSIGLGRFDKASELLIDAPNSEHIADWFNFAMAKWGITGKPDLETLRKVVLDDKERSISRSQNSPNYLQCLAMAHYTVGYAKEALEFARRARESMVIRPRREFSAWTYSRVGSRDFLAHVTEMEKQIRSGVPLEPDFLHATAPFT